MPPPHRLDQWNAKWELETLEDEKGNWGSGNFDYLHEYIETKDLARLPDFQVIGNFYENPHLNSS